MRVSGRPPGMFSSSSMKAGKLSLAGCPAPRASSWSCRPGTAGPAGAADSPRRAGRSAASGAGFGCSQRVGVAGPQQARAPWRPPAPSAAFARRASFGSCDEQAGHRVLLENDRAIGCSGKWSLGGSDPVDWFAVFPLDPPVPPRTENDRRRNGLHRSTHHFNKCRECKRPRHRCTPAGRPGTCATEPESKSARRDTVTAAIRASPRPGPGAVSHAGPDAGDSRLAGGGWAAPAAAAGRPRRGGGEHGRQRRRGDRRGGSRAGAGGAARAASAGPAAAARAWLRAR